MSSASPTEIATPPVPGPADAAGSYPRGSSNSSGSGASSRTHRASGLTLRECLSGGLAGALTEGIFYAIDSGKVMRQMGQRVEVARLLNGLGPMIMLGSAPSFAVFFGLYGPGKKYLEDDWGQVLSPFAQVLVASVAASVPTSIIGVPADVLKKRMMVTGEGFRGAYTALIRQQGWQSLLTGWKINVARDVPFVAIKMTLYEGMLRYYLRWRSLQGAGHAVEEVAGHGHAGSAHARASAVSSAESAMVGFGSGMLTAVLTQPMDVINTRTKAGGMAGASVREVLLSLLRSDGAGALFRGLAPRILTTGVGSTVFWFLYASVQQAIASPQ